jgi:hypothetical protein
MARTAALTLQAALGQWPSPAPGMNSPLDCSYPGSALTLSQGQRG